MKKRLIANKQLFQGDGFTRRCLWVSGGLLAVSVGFLAFNYTQLPPVVPLFYSLSRGQQQLVDRSFVVILPTLMTIFLLCHLFFIWLHARYDLIFARIVAASGLVISSLFFISVVHLLWLVL